MENEIKLRDLKFLLDRTKWNGSCLEWTCTRTRGYGITKLRGKTYRAHRAVWEMIVGPIPKGLFVCHSCDNPSCVNVGHLFLGTHTENMRDMRSKGRAAASKVTHCPKGHEYDQWNTIYENKPQGRTARVCRACKIAKRRHHYVTKEQPARAFLKRLDEGGV